MTRALPLLLLAVPLLSQAPAFREETLHGRRAFVLDNQRLRVSTLPGGGFLAEIRFKSEDPRLGVNPMRVPHYPTIDPFQYDPGKHGALYGTGSQRRLMSGYMGHFLCLPHYGATSEAELRQDLGNHGEALAVEWKRQKVEAIPSGVTLWYAADLPQNQYRVERSITLPSDETVGYVHESVENLAPYDRPLNWVQHITFGPPFLEPGKNFVDAPVVKVALPSGSEVREASWPRGQDLDGQVVDFRLFPATPKSGRYRAWLLDRSRSRVYFTMCNPEYRVLIGYLFPAADNPWIGDWQENQRVTGVPWNGQAIARGIDIGTTPIAEGLRRSVERGRLFDVPTYRWIQARERLSQSYLFFLAEIPLGFKGVADLRHETGRIVLVERETGRTISIPSARSR